MRDNLGVFLKFSSIFSELAIAGNGCIQGRRIHPISYSWTARRTDEVSWGEGSDFFWGLENLNFVAIISFLKNLKFRVWVQLKKGPKKNYSPFNKLAQKCKNFSRSRIERKVEIAKTWFEFWHFSNPNF